MHKFLHEDNILMSKHQSSGRSGGTYAQRLLSASSRIRKTHRRLKAIQKDLITQTNEVSTQSPRQINVTVVCSSTRSHRNINHDCLFVDIFLQKYSKKAAIEFCCVVIAVSMLAIICYYIFALLYEDRQTFEFF